MVVNVELNEREIYANLVREAAKSRAEDSRNHPMVAACVVKDGVVLGYAFRGETGEGDHAEFGLLEKKLGTSILAGATVYTTLEPCTSRKHPKVHCARRLAEHRVARVVIGMLDPNPDVLGKGVQQLRDANIEVSFFPKESAEQIEELNRNFTRRFNHNRALSPLEFDSQRLLLAEKVARYLPSRIYSATARPSKDFNEDLRADLKSSTSYVFRGGTGRYVPLRLAKLVNLPMRISIGLINPTDSNVVTQRALDRISQRGLDRSVVNDVYREIVEQIQTCIVGVFDFRHSCEITLSFGEDTSAFRHEVFDAAAYVSMYHSWEKSYWFPETLRFDKDSVFYRSFKLDCERHFRMCPHTIRFTADSGEQALYQALAQLGFNSDPSAVAEVRQAYAQFAKEFYENTS